MSKLQRKQQARPQLAKVRSSQFLIGGLSSALIFLTLLPIIWSPVTADDIANSRMRIAIKELPGNFLLNLFRVFKQNTLQWVNTEGRFFPGATLYGVLIHTIFQGKGLYKIFLFLISLSFFVLLYIVLNTIFGFTAASIACLFSLAGYSLRYRYFHDGISSFTGQVPFAGGLFLLSILLLIHKRISERRGNYVLAVLSLIYASLTYEHISTFIPAMILLVWFYSPLTTKKRNVITLSAVFLGLVIITLILRHDVNPANSYKLSFLNNKFGNTFLQQFISPLPLSQYLFTKENFLGQVQKNFISHNLGWILLIAVGWFASTLGSFRFLERIPIEKKTGVVSSVPALLGASMMFFPSVITGGTVRWQTELPDGEGYLCTSLQSIGIAFLIGFLIERLLLAKRVLGAQIARILFIGLVSFLVSANIAWNWGFNY